MMFITISREYGAGGSVVARLVADALRWRLVDNQVVEEVARRAGLTPDDVARREERGPSFVERLARALSTATPELLGPTTVQPPEEEESRLVKLTEQVVRDACADGHVVLVGRAAVALLGSRDDALHVRVVADPEHRTRVIMDRLGVARDEAVKQIKAVDANRARYHRLWYDRDWHESRNYHLTLNTGWLGLERSAELVVRAAEPLVRQD
jgi:cytidylate kinase